jgi:hypothetical protein
MLDPVVDKGQLTETDRFIFESWGYFVIPGVLTKDEAAEAYDVSQRLHRSRDREFGQIGRTYESEPVLERLIDHPDVLPKVQGLLGDRFVLQAGWNTMQPAHAGNGRWHQDGSSAFDFKDLGYPVPLLQLRVSYLLTDQTVPGMGNMELIPGSHRSRVGLPDSVRQNNDDVAIGHVICAEADPCWCSTTGCGTGRSVMTATRTGSRRITSTARRGSGPPTGSATTRSSWSGRHRCGGR